MRKYLLPVPVLITLLFSHITLADNKSDAQKQQDNPAVVAITTVTYAEGTGCWVKIYDGENYKGKTLTLIGEQSLPNLEFGIGNDWEGDIDSILVGPKANLVLYEDENYLDKKSEVASGSKVPDLHKTLLSEGVESLKITCKS